jgi:hypothetical protein
VAVCRAFDFGCQQGMSNHLPVGIYTTAFDRCWGFIEKKTLSYV